MTPTPSPPLPSSQAASGAEAHPAFVLTELLHAPRELVFKVWTDPAHLLRWFGPKGMPMFDCKMDFRVGGSFLYGLTMPSGQKYWGKWVYRDIVAPERIELVQCFSDAEGGATRHPMAPDWPLYTHSTTTFEAQGDKTLLTLSWSPWEPTETEQRIFDASHASMAQGWGGTMELLRAYLEQEQAR